MWPLPANTNTVFPSDWGDSRNSERDCAMPSSRGIELHKSFQKLLPSLSRALKDRGDIARCCRFAKSISGSNFLSSGERPCIPFPATVLTQSLERSDPESLDGGSLPHRECLCKAHDPFPMFLPLTLFQKFFFVRSPGSSGPKVAC